MSWLDDLATQAIRTAQFAAYGEWIDDRITHLRTSDIAWTGLSFEEWLKMERTLEVTTQGSAWAKWPDHDGHNIGHSLGDVVCATCNYETLERNTQPFPDANEGVAPFWEDTE
jgi:hypothetical protein